MTRLARSEFFGALLGREQVGRRTGAIERVEKSHQVALLALRQVHALLGRREPHVLTTNDVISRIQQPRLCLHRSEAAADAAAAGGTVERRQCCAVQGLDRRRLSALTVTLSIKAAS